MSWEKGLTMRGFVTYCSVPSLITLSCQIGATPKEFAMTKVRIVGGMSLPGCIMLNSTTHAAIAKHEGEGVIKVTTRRRAVIPVDDASESKWVPLTVRLIRHFFQALTPRDRLQWIILLGAFYALDRAGFVKPNAGIPGWLITSAIGLAAVWFVYSTRPWHAAEHMAIGSYANGEGSASFDSIAQADRVHPRCGGRFVLPFLLLMPLCEWLLGFTSVSAGLAPFAAMLLVAETAFGVDALVGWYKLPVFCQASQLLQRHITTAPPDEVHLRTAETALVMLIYAAEHAEEVGEESIAKFVTGGKDVMIRL
jgi:hypothetical protein